MPVSAHLESQGVPATYHENWILKKEGVSQWVSYWCAIRGRWMQFYERGVTVGNRSELKKTLELTPLTQCALVARRKKRFPFSINNGQATYHMKCTTEMERYHWIFSILSASQGRPKTRLPKVIPSSMLESEAFKKHSENSATGLSNSPEKASRKAKPSGGEGENEVSGAVAQFSSLHRQKYAERCEKKAKRKQEKRARKLRESQGDLFDESAAGERNRTNRAFPPSSGGLYRTQKIKQVRDRVHDDQSGLTDHLRVRFEDASDSSQHADCIVAVHANPGVHTTTLLYTCPGDVNAAYEDEDAGRVLRKGPASIEDDVILPNMIVEEFSEDDDDDDDNTSTAETSLSSANSFLCVSTTNIHGQTSCQSSPSRPRSIDRLDSRRTDTYLSNDSSFQRRPRSGEATAYERSGKLTTPSQVPSSHLYPIGNGLNQQVNEKLQIAAQQRSPSFSRHLGMVNVLKS